MSQVGQALVYAHEHHIVHGNIKPENILLDANGQAVLTDFALVERKDAIIRDQTHKSMPFVIWLQSNLLAPVTQE